MPHSRKFSVIELTIPLSYATQISSLCKTIVLTLVRYAFHHLGHDSILELDINFTRENVWCQFICVASLFLCVSNLLSSLLLSLSFLYSFLLLFSSAPLGQKSNSTTSLWFPNRKRNTTVFSTIPNCKQCSLHRFQGSALQILLYWALRH